MQSHSCPCSRPCASLSQHHRQCLPSRPKGRSSSHGGMMGAAALPSTGAAAGAGASWRGCVSWQLAAVPPLRAEASSGVSTPARAAPASAVAREEVPVSSARDFDVKVYLDASVSPPHFVGPVAAASIPGKGRGLVATEALQPGQLLLVVPPLALVEGELGDIPEHDELVELITSSGVTFSPWQAQWLAALTTTTHTDQQQHQDHDNSSRSSSSICDAPLKACESSQPAVQPQAPQQQQQEQQPLVPALVPPPGQGGWWGSGSAGGASSDDTRPLACADGAVGFDALGMTEEQLWAAVVLNCYGEGFPDLPASLCAAAPLHSQLGLWGAFSLINHSCCPTAINYALRDTMVVRCCAPTAPGQEVTINYLGRSALRPRSQRQQELQACYGFDCDCRRCQTEASWAKCATASGVSLTSLLDDLDHQISTSYEPRLRRIQQAQEQQSCRDDDTSGSEAAAHSLRAQPLQQQQHQELLQLLKEMQQRLDELQAAATSCAAACTADSSSSSTPGSQYASSSSSSSNLVQPQQLQQQQQQWPGGEAEMSEQQAWVLSAAFDLLGLQYDASELLGQPDAAVLGAIVRVCEGVCPGSDLHIFQALRSTSLAQQQGLSAGLDADVALQGLVRALQVRYGPQVAEDEGVLSRMVAATSEAANMVWL